MRKQFLKNSIRAEFMGNSIKEEFIEILSMGTKNYLKHTIKRLE